MGGGAWEMGGVWESGREGVGQSKERRQGEKRGGNEESGAGRGRMNGGATRRRQ